MLGLSRALFFAEGIAGTASYRGLQGSQEAGAAACPGRTEPGTGLVVGQGPRHCPAPFGAGSGVSPSSHIPFPKPAPSVGLCLGAGMQTGWEGWSWAAVGWTWSERARAAQGAGEGFFFSLKAEIF